MREISVVWLLLAAGLAGCIGNDGDETVTPTGGNATVEDLPASDSANASATSGPQLEVSWMNGTIQGAGHPLAGIYSCNPQACENALAFTLDSNATAIVIEAAWNASTGMRLAPDAPDEGTCEPVDPVGLLSRCSNPESVSGSSPLVLEITSEDWTTVTGDWAARLWAEHAPQPAEVTLVATVVYDETPTAEAQRLAR